MATAFDFDRATAEEWILLKTGKLPTTTLGWFRAGVAFYNKGKYDKCIECMKKSVQLDSMNYNAYQVMARACIATNRRDEAITALKMSTKLDNPSDWQVRLFLLYCYVSFSLTSKAPIFARLASCGAHKWGPRHGRDPTDPPLAPVA